MDELKEFFCKEFWLCKNWNLDTKLEKDLRIYGDEGVLFLEKFLNYFDISYDKNREWQTHFSAEGIDLIGVSKFIFWLRGENKGKG